MGSKEFRRLCVKEIINYYNGEISEDDVYTVWECKTLQNNKLLASTNISDTRYFEFTHNGDKKEIYLDCYTKECNKCIKL